MNFAFAQLALIFLPGIIWANLDASYGSSSKTDKPTLALNAFLFGISTYSVLFVGYFLFGYEFSTSAINNYNDINLSDFVDEIIWSVPVSFLLAVVWLYSVRFRWIMKILNGIGATTRFGTEDVWSFTFNSSQAHVEYIDLRDVEKGFVYSGYVNAYSEVDGIRELLLTDVIVWNDNGDEVTRAPHLYLSKSKDNIWIEFPYTKES